MADPITLTGLLVGAICGIPGGVLANRADSLVCRFSKEFIGNLTEVGVRRNHDALRAIRLAQLNALGSLGRALRAGKAVVTPADMFDCNAFLPRLDDFLQREEEAAPNLSLTEGLAKALAASVDATLAAPSTGTGAARLESFAAIAASCTWHEIDALNPPSAFRTLFDGRERGVPSWFQAYGVFLGQALKKNADFRAIFTADRLANILSETIDLRSAVDSFVADSDRRHGELISALGQSDATVKRVEDLTGRTLLTVETARAEALDGQKRLEPLIRHAEAQQLSATRDKLIELRRRLYDLGTDYDRLGAQSAGMEGASIVGKIIGAYESYSLLFPDPIRTHIDGLLSSLRKWGDQDDDKTTSDTMLDLFSAVQEIWKGTEQAISTYAATIKELEASNLRRT